MPKILIETSYYANNLLKNVSNSKNISQKTFTN